MYIVTCSYCSYQFPVANNVTEKSRYVLTCPNCLQGFYPKIKEKSDKNWWELYAEKL